MWFGWWRSKQPGRHRYKPHGSDRAARRIATLNLRHDTMIGHAVAMLDQPTRELPIIPPQP